MKEDSETGEQETLPQRVRLETDTDAAANRRQLADQVAGIVRGAPLTTDEFLSQREARYQRIPKSVAFDSIAQRVRQMCAASTRAERSAVASGMLEGSTDTTQDFLEARSKHTTVRTPEAGADA